MADLNRGKTIFENLVEYPLPDQKKAGVRDYIFYFIPAGDKGYGDAARYFFNTYYQHHVKKDVRTFEGLISTLDLEIKGGIQHIREIVIVAHGNAEQLLFPLLDGVTPTNLFVFNCLTAYSIACLQKDLIDDGKFQIFGNKRKNVIAHLQDDSWVTIRACNFGQSAKGMYALYSLFGGKANVYAPKEYMFFGESPIGPGMLFHNQLDVHTHLVKQRFLHKDIHTPERRDTFIKAIIDPAKFTQPLELASISDADSLYQELINDLNARKITTKLMSRFLDQRLELSSLARVQVVKKNSSWIIKDFIKLERFNFAPIGITYQIRNNKENTIVSAQAQLSGLMSSRALISIQRFFSTRENDIYKGKLFMLAYSTAESTDEPELQLEEGKFNAVLELLNQNSFNDTVGNDIRAEFQRGKNVQLSPSATIKLVSTTGTDPFKKISWIIADQGNQYLVKLEHPFTADGVRMHVISVYISFKSEEEHIQREYELLSKQGYEQLGEITDIPGTELPAYLDRFTKEELVDLIDYLRSPYKPDHSIYIYHAAQALSRKKDYMEWWRQRYPDIHKLPPLFDPYSAELYLGTEYGDKNDLVYPFTFSSVWREVKASSPASIAINRDLFEEENLAKKLNILRADLEDRTPPADIEIDSPATNMEKLRERERNGLEQFYSNESKELFDVPEEDQDCKELAEVVNKFKEVQHLQPEEIKRILGEQKTAAGKSYLDLLGDLGDHYGFLKDIGNMIGFGLPEIPTDAIDLAEVVVKRIPFLSRIAFLRALFAIEFVITIPFEMWMQFLELQEEAAQIWENKGKLIAVRQWLGELWRFARVHQDDFPDQVQIEMVAETPADVTRRFYAEQREQWGQVRGRHVFFPKRMKKGFDEGAKEMGRVGEEIIYQAQESVNEFLQQSNLGSCKLKILIDSGILNLKKLKAQAVIQIIDRLLDKLPKV